MEIEIKDRKIEIKHSFKAEIIFEAAEEKSFTGASAKDWITMFFCSVLASSNDDAFIDFKTFLEWLDDHEMALYDFITSYTEHAVRVNEMRKAQDEKKKKASRKKN